MYLLEYKHFLSSEFVWQFLVFERKKKINHWNSPCLYKIIMII